MIVIRTSAPLVRKNHSVPMTRAQRTMVLKMRFATALGKLLRGRGWLELLAREAETSLALGKLCDRGGEVGLGEIGPEHRREHELQRGGLQQEEIAYAHLTRRADDEIGIGQVGGREVAAERLP